MAVYLYRLVGTSYMIRIVYRDIDSYSVQRLIVYRFLRAHF